jgi:acetylornithine deacetylase
MGQLTFALEELHASYAKAHPDSASAIHFDTIHAGYELPRRGPMLELLKKVYKRHKLPFAPGSFPSHSDANILWAAGIKPILLGPGKLEKAHTAEESVHLPQVLQAAQVYLDLAIGIEDIPDPPPLPAPERSPAKRQRMHITGTKVSTSMKATNTSPIRASGTF